MNDTRAYGDRKQVYGEAVGQYPAPSELDAPRREPGRELAVNTALMHLGASMDRLQKVVETLAHRLGPVLGPEYPSKASLADDGKNTTSDMARQINAAADIISSRGYVLESLLERLEI